MPYEIRELTPDQIKASIATLEKRAQDVQKLLDDNLQYDDAKGKNVESWIQQNVLDAFGQNSPQFDDFRNYRISFNPRIGATREDSQEKFERDAQQAATRINGLITILVERLENAKADPEHKGKGSF